MAETAVCESSSLASWQYPAFSRMSVSPTVFFVPCAGSSRRTWMFVLFRTIGTAATYVLVSSNRRFCQSSSGCGNVPTFLLHPRIPFCLFDDLSMVLDYGSVRIWVALPVGRAALPHAPRRAGRRVGRTYHSCTVHGDDKAVGYPRSLLFVAVLLLLLLFLLQLPLVCVSRRCCRCRRCRRCSRCSRSFSCYSFVQCFP